MVQEFRSMPYDARLKSLDWCTLMERRLRGDMIQVLMLLHPVHFFISHLPVIKLYKCNFRTNICKYAFSNGIIDYWNNLPQHIVSSNNVYTFEHRLDQRYLHHQGFE